MQLAQGKSKLARYVAPIEFANTISCYASKKSSGCPRRSRGDRSMPERLARRLARGLAAVGAVLAAYYFLFGGEYDLRDLRELKRARAEAARVQSPNWAARTARTSTKGVR